MMNMLEGIIQTIVSNYTNEGISTVNLISMLAVVLVLALYEYGVYRVVSRRAYYNRSLNIAIAILPFLISTIILCLQSNIIITLGTIGALAIVRFRTAVKDPVDMVYILWAIHTGIVCGCQLYKVSILTSIIITVVMVCFNLFKNGEKGYCLVASLKTSGDEGELVACVKQHSKHFRVKNRNYSGKSVDYVIECALKNPQEMLSALEQKEIVERFSLMEYDSGNMV